MKFLRVSDVYYPHALEGITDIVEKNSEKNFNTCRDLVLKNRFMYSDALTKELSKYDYDAQEIITDSKSLQQKWAIENNISYSEDNWKIEIFYSQLRTIQPDILYLQGPYVIPFEFRKNIKFEFKFIKLVILYLGLPEAYDQLEGIDLIFGCTPNIVSRVPLEARPKTRLVYHSFDTTVATLNHVKQPKKINFSFVGSTGCGLVGNHLSRYHTLIHLMDETPLEIWGNEISLNFLQEIATKPTKKVLNNHLKAALNLLPLKLLNKILAPQILPQFLREKLDDIRFAKIAEYLFPKLGEKGLEALIRGNSLPPKFVHLAQIYLHDWRAYNFPGIQECYDNDLNKVQFFPHRPVIPISSIYPNRCHPPVFGSQMFDLHSSSKISLNIHTNYVAGMVGNMRMFEVTGVGGCLLTDTGGNLKDLFKPDEEVVTFSNKDECREKALYLLENDKVRETISRSGMKKTLSSHTFKIRCREIDHHIQDCLKN